MTTMIQLYFCSILTKALVTANAAKAAHNYTDTTGFSLKYDSEVDFIFHVNFSFLDVLFVEPN